MTMLEISVAQWWLIAGIICLIIEFTHLPNVGFIFLGLGALSNAVILNNYPELLKYQYIILGPTSFLWFAILWWPMKYYVHKKTNKVEYSDMIGKEVQVYSDKLLLGETGQVSWSGTIMNTRLAKDQLTPVNKGDKLYIIGIEGNVLICSNIKLKS